MDFYSWLNTLQRPTFKGDDQVSDMQSWQEGMRQLHTFMTTPDAAGRLPYGTNIAGFVPQEWNAYAPAPMFETAAGPQMRVGRSQQDMAANPVLSKYLNGMAVNYSPEYGYYADRDSANTFGASVAVGEDKDDMVTSWLDNGGAVFALMAAGMGGALGGAFPGVDAAGNAIAAGETGILSQLGFSNPFGTTSTGTEGLDVIDASDVTGGSPQVSYDPDWQSIRTQLQGIDDPIQFLDQLDTLGGGQGATAGAKMLGFDSVQSALGAFNPTWVGNGVTMPDWAGEAKTAAAAGGTKSLVDLLTDPKTLLSGATALGSTLLQRDAIKDAVDAQTAASTAATNAALSMYNQNRADLEPWRTAGGTAVKRLSDMLQPGYKFGEADADPGYAFRMAEGQKALERSAAARGGLFSGNTGKALTQYGQNFASNEFTNSTNRLANLAGLGQTSAGTTAALGATTAGRVGDYAIGAGNARASGYVGGANAAAGSLSGFLRNMQEQELLDILRSRSSGTMTTPFWG